MSVMDGMISSKMLAHFAGWRKGETSAVALSYALRGCAFTDPPSQKLHNQLTLPEETRSHQDLALRLQHAMGIRLPSQKMVAV